MSETSELSQSIELLQNRLTAKFGNKTTCEVTECGSTGGGGFVVDHGSTPKIIAMQFRKEGLFVKITQGTWYNVVQIKTDDMASADAYIRTLMPCSAEKTKWPPGKMEVKIRKAGEHLRFAGFLGEVILYGLLAKPLGWFARRRRPA